MATDLMCVVRVLISFNGLRRGEAYTLPLTDRVRAFARLGFLDIVTTVEVAHTPVYELDLDDDDEDAA